MKYLLLALLSLPVHSEVTIGYLVGKHITTDQQLNNSHPFIDFDNVMIFKNSFEHTSIAPYYKLESEHFKLRLGFTSGYEGKMVYNGYVYEQETIYGLIPFIVPTFEYKVNHATFIIGVMGNSINTGLGFNF